MFLIYPVFFMWSVSLKHVVVFSSSPKSDKVTLLLRLSQEKHIFFDFPKPPASHISQLPACLSGTYYDKLIRLLRYRGCRVYFDFPVNCTLPEVRGQERRRVEHRSQRRI